MADRLTPLMALPCEEIEKADITPKKGHSDARRQPEEREEQRQILYLLTGRDQSLITKGRDGGYSIKGWHRAVTPNPNGEGLDSRVRDPKPIRTTPKLAGPRTVDLGWIGQEQRQQRKEKEGIE
jgi:hypothetical protein